MGVFLAALPAIAAVAPEVGAAGAAAGGLSAGTLSAGLGAVGSLVSAVGAISQGNAASAEASYQAQIARNNEKIAQQNANYATASGEARALDVGLKERAAGGAVKAGIAANNLDVNSGSAADLRVTQTELGELDTERTRNDAALRAYGYRSNATSYESEARLDEAKASYDSEAGWMKAFGTLIGSASSVPSKFSGMGKTGGGDVSPYGTAYKGWNWGAI